MDNPAELLNQARANLLVAEANFYKVLAELRQSTRFGFKNARELRDHYSQPIVIFTRKGNIDNAITAYEDEKLDAVIKKPDPRPTLVATLKSGDLYRLYGEALQDSADDSQTKIESIIRRSKWWQKNRALAATFILGVTSSTVVALLFLFLG